MKRVIKFKRYFQHEETGNISVMEWGCIDWDKKGITDFSAFTAPGQNNRAYPIADCQFIGLVDKNKREVFDGDIVRFIDDVTVPDNPCECITDVFWWDEYPGWALHNTHFELSFLTFDKIEVIGNIHENPELL